MTTSTSGRSRPRAATSVVRRTQGDDGIDKEDENADNERVRADVGRCPCTENRFVD
jgi:hypothetical protein